MTWFDASRRVLPWRDAPCGVRDPYRVWLSEVMLQQTVVATVEPYFLAFVDAWPDVQALAAAGDDEVMGAWAGLGYYARARNMMKCARLVVREYQGVFPRSESDLRALPGIGPYTAAAIAAIAFNASTVPVDGNVMRTLSRLFAVADEMPAHKDKIAIYAQGLLPAGRGGDFAEALMDLGATVCRPKAPRCGICPWVAFCRAYGGGDPVAYPKKVPARAKPTRRGWAFWIERADGYVLLERRAEKGLLGGMMGFPTTPWAAHAGSARAAKAWLNETWLGEARPAGAWKIVPGTLSHTFTHFHLELDVLCVKLGTMDIVPARDASAIWCALHRLDRQALPSVMKKVARHTGNL